MKDNVVVSIIVPCYNVGQYVEQCIRSLMGQCYNNLEIIPVDDGSKDNTPHILDSLAVEDNRINVIHKNNEGVSAARNTGLDVATGEYVIFVDGDDFLALDYVEYMLSLAAKDNADFVMSENCFTIESQHQVGKEDVRTISPVEATALLISPRVIVGCWNKMFRRSFLNDNKLRFSTSLFYGEGLYFIIKSAQLSNRVTVGNRMVYFYRRNNESSATTKYNIEKYHNGEIALDIIRKELLVKDEEVMLMMALHKSMFCIGALSQTYAHCLQTKYKDDCNHWKSVIKGYLPKIISSNHISMYRKLLLLGGVLFPNIVCKLDMWRRKRIANQSVS